MAYERLDFGGTGGGAVSPEGEPWVELIPAGEQGRAQVPAEHTGLAVAMEVISHPAGKATVDPVGADSDDARGVGRPEGNHFAPLEEEVNAVRGKVGATGSMVETRQTGCHLVD